MAKLFLVVTIFLFCGCAALTGAYQDIKDNPVGFHQEAQEVGDAIKIILPDGSVPGGAVGIGIGYAIAFLRRVYVNAKRKKTDEIA